MVDPISRRGFLVPAMRLRRYPPELRDLIIDQLHDDHTSLRSCSLTCHAWLPRARYHIFARIKLSLANRDAFRCLLHNTPEIARYIQDVNICGSGGESWWSRGDSHFRLSGRWPTLGQPASRYTGSAEREIVAWLQKALPESTKLLTRVKRLTLSSILVCAPLTDILRRYFSTVKILVFNRTQSLSFDDYIQFGRAFVDVSAMHMLDARWFPHPCTTRSEEIDKVRRKITTLELSRTIDVVTLIDWLLDQPHCTDLRTLSCFLTSHASAKSISQLLQTLGSKLENLSIGFSDTRDPSDILKATNFTLKSLTGLRNLRVPCGTADRFSTHHLSLSWILLLLSKVNSPFLETLTLSIPAQDLCSLNYEGLIVVLSHVRYKPLKRLIFDVEVRPTVQYCRELEKKVQSRLSVLDVQLEFNTLHQ